MTMLTEAVVLNSKIMTSSIISKPISRLISASIFGLARNKKPESKFALKPIIESLSVQGVMGHKQLLLLPLGGPCDQFSQLQARKSPSGDLPMNAFGGVSERKKEMVESYLKSLNYLPGCRGVIACVNGRFIAVDIFDRDDSLKMNWRNLIVGYALDAIERGPEITKPFSAKGASMLLDHAAELTCEKYSAVSCGRVWRFWEDDIIGRAIEADHNGVHISIFPNTNNGKISKLRN